MGTEITMIPEISLNTQNCSSIRLSAQGMTYPQRCFGQMIRVRDGLLGKLYLYIAIQTEIRMIGGKESTGK
jgi:hypothetical protein